MSTLQTIYEEEGSAALDRLHEATGASRKYLYQIATNRRRPSPELAKLLIQADSRLTLDALLFGGAEISSTPRASGPQEAV